MPDLPAAEVRKLQAEHGYGMIRAADGAGAGFSAMWAAPWPPPEWMVMIIPNLLGPTMVEVPSEPEHLEAMRGATELGWTLYMMERGRHSAITDEQAKGMTHVMRVAEYHQREVFEP